MLKFVWLREQNRLLAKLRKIEYYSIFMVLRITKTFPNPAFHTPRGLGEKGSTLGTKEMMVQGSNGICDSRTTEFHGFISEHLGDQSGESIFFDYCCKQKSHSALF
jgi:hypothetical protein